MTPSANPRRVRAGRSIDANPLLNWRPKARVAMFLQVCRALEHTHSLQENVRFARWVFDIHARGADTAPTQEPPAWV